MYIAVGLCIRNIHGDRVPIITSTRVCLAYATRRSSFICAIYATRPACRRCLVVNNSEGATKDFVQAAQAPATYQRSERGRERNNTRIAYVMLKKERGDRRGHLAWQAFSRVPAQAMKKLDCCAAWIEPVKKVAAEEG